MEQSDNMFRALAQEFPNTNSCLVLKENDEILKMTVTIIICLLADVILVLLTTDS